MKGKPDVLIGAALLAFCAATWAATTAFREVPSALSQNVPPTFFPRLVLAVIAALSVVLIALGVTRPRKPAAKTPATVVVTAAIFVIAVALIPYLGMLATVCLLAIVLPLYWGERRALLIGTLAIALPLAVHVVFAVALGMGFPVGVLW